MHIAITYSNRPIELTFNARWLEDGFFAVPEDLLDDNGKLLQPIGLDEDGDEVLPDEFVHLADDLDEAKRILALRIHLDDWTTSMSVADDDQTVRVGNSRYNDEWLVVTDDEADVLWDQDLENYIDECLEIPDSVRPYLDHEAWKKDARIDGRAHSLGRYDGNEWTEEINDGISKETYYLYRTN